MGGNNFLKWITVPPVVAIATIMLARAMGTGNVSGEVDLSVWGLVWLLFIVISVLYGLFIAHGFSQGLVPLQALAQGILLCPMSIMYGARMFQWLGVILAVCGAAALVVAYNQTEAERNKVVVLEVEDDLKQLPVNFAITDETGAILNLTDDMLEVLGLSRLNMLGKNISEWFSPVSKTAEINGKIWDIKRISIDDGRRFYFELNPKGLPTGEESSEGGSTSGGVVLAFTDEDTQLHTFNYGFARISDELYRAGRYGRAVSAVMLRLVFPQLLPSDDMDKYTRPFRAYSARVINNIRQSDTAIQTGEFQILVVLSECPYQMVENVIERLTAITNALVPTFEEFMHVTVLSVYETFEGGNNVPSAQELIDRMTNAMTRKYSANALSE
ncbi:MAG: hypothetical protein IJT02_02675 [Synergistaceae bacterium]|nr:hypothetical protein [Synergistaceae bacterium]